MVDGEFDNLTVNNVLTLGADVSLSRSAANLLSIGTSGAIGFAPESTIKRIYDFGFGRVGIKHGIHVVKDAASDYYYIGAVDGDTNARITIDYTGKIAWGSGSAPRDTSLYRSAANTLKTNDSLDIQSGNNISTITMKGLAIE